MHGLFGRAASPENQPTVPALSVTYRKQAAFPVGGNDGVYLPVSDPLSPQGLSAAFVPFPNPVKSSSFLTVSVLMVP